MDAWVNDNGIRLNGLGAFQSTSPKGTLETILDKLKARTLQNGKCLYFESADVAIIYHTIPTADAVKNLPASGIVTHHSETPLTPKLREHLVKCEKAMQSVKPILGKLHFPAGLPYISCYWIYL